MVDTEVSGFISISGDSILSPEMLSQLLGLPDWKQGRLKPPYRKKAVWIFKTSSSARLEQRSVNECLSELLELPILNADKFDNLPEGIKKEVILTVFSDDVRPSIEVNAANLKSLARLDLSLRIAGYFDPPELQSPRDP
jgi:hypothetical protein